MNEARLSEAVQIGSAKIIKLLTHAARSVKDAQYAMKKYSSNPAKYRPQLDNLAQDLNSLRSTVKVMQHELEGLENEADFPPRIKLAKGVRA
jgi:hypothetical protein